MVMRAMCLQQSPSSKARCSTHQMRILHTVQGMSDSVMAACHYHHIERANTLESMRNNLPLRHRLCPTQADREHFTQLLFEQFNLAGLYLGEQGVLSLYSAGKITGTVIDLGHGKTGMSSLCIQNSNLQHRPVWVFQMISQDVLFTMGNLCRLLWMMSASQLIAPPEQHGHLAAFALQGMHWIRGIAAKTLLLLCRHQPGGGGPALCARLQTAALWWPGCDKEAAKSPQHWAGEQNHEARGAGAAEAQDHAFCHAGSTDTPWGEMLLLYYAADQAPDLDMSDVTMHAKCLDAAVPGAGCRNKDLVVVGHWRMRF